MKKLALAMLLVLLAIVTHAQAVSSDSSQWEFSAEVNFYFIPDDFFILPVFKADKGKLHLEARYNYEDMETFSGWAGYNFSGGNKLTYTITPMIGGVVGLTDGVAPGLEFNLGLGSFELYSESEYLFDFAGTENNFYYNWTDLSYLPTDWLWVGLSAQRTKVYQTELDIQRGLFVGAGLKQWELTTYFYNPGSDDPFVLVALSVGF